MKAFLSACALIALVPTCFTSYVPCEPCDQTALSMCAPVPPGCQAVKEPGCGCCMTCALREGHECGVYTGTCAVGLRCLPRAGEEKPLHALLNGRGLCMAKNDYKPIRDHEPSDDVLGPMTEDLRHHSKAPFFLQDNINNKKVLAVHKNRKHLLSKHRTMSHMDYSPLSMQNVQPEMGLCQRKLDITVRKMKDMPRVKALSLYLPNCDKRGFFKRKQCKSSRGQKRGICWCVDKYGAMMPGSYYSGSDILCNDPEKNRDIK